MLAAFAGCHPKHHPKDEPVFTATLVGLADDRSSGQYRSKGRGKIVAVDGKAIDLRPGKEVTLEVGCHIVEAEVEFDLTKGVCSEDRLLENM